jgi:hypothetical protein
MCLIDFVFPNIYVVHGRVGIEAHPRTESTRKLDVVAKGFLAAKVPVLQLN